MNNRYLLYLDNKKNFKPNDYKNVITVLRSMIDYITNIEIRDVRIASYFIEMDMTIPDTSEEQISKLSKDFGSIGSILYLDKLNENKDSLSIENTVLTGVYLFNMERYWKSHEVLENIWKDSREQTKLILNGLILVDAAFVHLQKGENDIFFSILNRAYQKLRNSPSLFYNIDMDSLNENIRKIFDNDSICNFRITYS